MIGLLKIVIFHGELLNNQMVIHHNYGVIIHHNMDITNILLHN